MLDENGIEIETQVTPSSDNKTVNDEGKDLSNKGEPMIPKSRLDQVSSQLKAEREQRALLEAKVNSLTETKDQDPDLQKVAEALSPLFVQKGFITKEQQEADESAKRYSEQLKNLSSKYDGEDGRPTFDPFEISEYAKQTQVFDLETAYEKKYKKELFDWEVQHMNDNGGDVDTEKAGEKVYNNGRNQDLLTRESIAKKLAEPGGAEWYEKNRDVLLKALEKGQIK